MPVKPCETNGRPGFKWGDQGKCYGYEPDDESSRREAHERAARQGRAVEASRALARKNARRRRGA